MADLAKSDQAIGNFLENWHVICKSLEGFLFF